MGELYSIGAKRESNVVYRLISRIHCHEIRDSKPWLFHRFRKMSLAIEASHQSDARLCQKIRGQLPQDLSPGLIPEAERLVDEAGRSLREDLFTLFSQEIDAALKRDGKGNN